jgi:uncharacterized protein (TIGR02271 family)
MTQTVVALYDDRSEAQRVLDDLLANGFNRSEVHTLDNSADNAQLLQELPSSVPEPDIRFYQEGVRQGGTLIVARVASNRAGQAADIMARYNMVDVDARSKQYAQAGSNFQLRDYGDEDYVLPVVEEQIQVGKRQVERGRMRVYTRVTETPVEQNVTVRDETVHIERRPVNKPVDASNANLFEDKSIEVTETDEEAVVSKEARVVEEVVVDKEMTERTETIRDTLRRTDVDIERSGDVDDQETNRGNR